MDRGPTGRWRLEGFLPSGTTSLPSAMCPQTIDRIDNKLFEALNIDVNQETELHRAEQTAKKLIMEAKAPKDIKDAIKSLYEHLCKIKGREAYVVVRSSATAEDLPDTSFSRQQETFLNMRGSEDIFNAVRKCWASLYGARAIFYCVEQGFEHNKVSLSAIVQLMVDSEKSGVMFSSQPSTGELLVVIEAAWGLGKSVVSGSVSPDNYIVDRKTKKTTSKYIATKEIIIIRTLRHIRQPQSRFRRRRRRQSSLQIRG